MMSDGIRALLDDENSELQRKWADYVRRRIQASHRMMSQRYDGWRESEQLDRAFRVPDEQDQKTRNRTLTQGVQKIVVPYSYAQIRALIAFFMSIFTQRSPTIPVAGLGPGDVRAGILHELILDFQCSNMDPHYLLVLYQWLYDAARYGIGVVRNNWVIREWPDLERTVVPILGPDGSITSYEETIQHRDVIAYEGNEALNVSPFRWFPDPNVPMGQFQRGEFCAHEQRLSWSYLETLAAEGLRAGLQWIPKGTTQDAEYSHGQESDLPRIVNMTDPDPWPTDEYGKPYTQNHDLFCFVHPEDLTTEEIQTYRDEDGQPARRWKAPRLFVMTLTNNWRITRIEPANLPGRRYPYEAIELNYDTHSPGNVGLVEVTSGLQNHYSWLFNSRMQSVRKTINNQFVVDPSMIEESDLESDEPGLLLRLKRQHWQSDAVKNAVYPLPTQDVTQGHISLDAPMVRDLMDLVLGIPPPMLGQVNRGRRSATEIQGTMTSASGRGKMLLEIATRQGIGPHAMQMIRNNQVFLDQMTLRLRPPYDKLFGQPMLQVTPDMLAGEFTIPFGEMGIPTDKQMESQVWMNFLQQAMSAGAMPPLPPQFWQVVASRFLWSMNIRDLGSAGLTMANLSIVPDEVVQQQVQAGNLAQAPQGQGAPTQDGFTQGPQGPMNGNGLNGGMNG